MSEIADAFRRIEQLRIGPHANAGPVSKSSRARNAIKDIEQIDRVRLVVRSLTQINLAA
jgi:hypothetical protein